MSALKSLLLLTVVTGSCLGELTFTANLPEGRSSKEPGTYTDLLRTSDGYLIEILTREGTDTYILEINWIGDGESWYRLSVDQMLNDDNLAGPYPPFELTYDPWVTPDMNQLQPPPFSIVAQPTEFAGYLSLIHRGDSPPTPEGRLVVLEFSVEEISPPDPADFNYDGVVDFTDFLYLSRHYETDHPAASFPMHFRGDANLDFNVDFEDFLILQHNFGRKANSLSISVPEPSWNAIILAIVPVLSIARRRR